MKLNNLKIKESEQIAKQTAEFLASGGKIDKKSPYDYKHTVEYSLRNKSAFKEKEK